MYYLLYVFHTYNKGGTPFAFIIITKMKAKNNLFLAIIYVFSLSVLNKFPYCGKLIQILKIGDEIEKTTDVSKIL